MSQLAVFDGMGTACYIRPSPFALIYERLCPQSQSLHKTASKAVASQKLHTPLHRYYTWHTCFGTSISPGVLFGYIKRCGCIASFTGRPLGPCFTQRGSAPTGPFGALGPVCQSSYEKCPRWTLGALHSPQSRRQPERRPQTYR